MCDKFPFIDERKQSLSQQGRCFMVDHMLKECPSSQKKCCCYCGRRVHHNQCLCPQKFGKPTTEKFVVSAADTSCQTPGLTSFNGYTTSSAGNNAVGSTDASRVATNVTSNTALLASGERVLLQTAVVQVQNLDELVTVKANILMDSAS